jgi:hypothetical protein
MNPVWSESPYRERYESIDYLRDLLASMMADQPSDSLFRALNLFIRSDSEWMGKSTRAIASVKLLSRGLNIPGVVCWP